MSERIVDDLEIIEIEKEKSPRAGLVAGQAGQCCVKARPIREFRQRVGTRQTLTFEHALMPLESDGAQMDTSIHYSLFGGGGPPVLGIIEGERAQDPVVGTEYGARPARFQTLAEWMLLVGKPPWIGLDVRHRDGCTQIGGTAAGSHHRADRHAGYR